MKTKPEQTTAELRTDLGNARSLVRLHGSDFRYCKPWGKWLVWDEIRWKIDDTGQVERFAKSTAGEMLRDANKIEDLETRRGATAHALRSQSRGRLDAMVEVAKTEGRIVVTPDQIDKEPYLLNCKNGTLDLRNGQLNANLRTDLLMKLAPTEYNESACCPVFDKFLARIMGDSAELIAYVQRCFGYALTGYVSEKAIFVLVGGGDNGKTTLIEALRHVLAACV